MSEETTETVVEVADDTVILDSETTEVTTDTVVFYNETTETEEVQPEEEAEVEDKPDMVAQTVAENVRLAAEIEELKSADNNVFEQNAILKSELEDAKKLAQVETENTELKAKLETIKRDAITASLGLTDKQKVWADSLTFQQLEEYASMMPRRKTILDEKNEAKETDIMTDFKKTVNRSRIM